MKRKNNKLLTLMLAGMLCTAAVGAVATTSSVDAAAATSAKKYALSTVFETGAASTSSFKGNEAGKTELTLKNGGSIAFKNNLAIKWFTAKDTPEYMSLTFTFADVQFEEIKFTFNSASLHAAKDGIAVNTVTFYKENDVIMAKANDAEGKETTVADDAQVTLSLSDEGCDLGCYKVFIGSLEIGEFTNIGAKYFSNADEMVPFAIEAKTETETKLYVDSINGQSFSGIAEDKVTDNAAPVLVVNEDIRGFLLGAKFELDCKEIDVLDSSLSSKKTYYQYNFIDTAATYEKEFKQGTSGTYFMDTTIYKNSEGAYSLTKDTTYTKATTVFREKKAEYVSLKYELADDTYTGTEADDEHKKNVVELAWYVDSAVISEVVAEYIGVDFIKFNRSEDGPELLVDAKEIVDVENNKSHRDIYEEKVQENSKDVSAGSNAKVELPSLSWLIGDKNNGYQSLQFTISYKTPSSSSAKTSSNLDSDDLEISVDEAGWYEFKVFANDVAGNAMMVYDEDGELVKVTTSNVWDLERIPSFTFEVLAKGIKTESGEDSDTLDTQLLGETYTMSSVSIVGAASEKSAYDLYKINLGNYTGAGAITTDILSGIKFAALKTKAEELVAAELKKEGVVASEIDFNDINKQAYIHLIVKAVEGSTYEDVEKIFVAIEEYDDRITEEDESAWEASSNKYNWKPASMSFKAAESGLYIIVADYWDDEMLFVDHAPAYQLIEVASEADVIKGETEWLKNNLVSVILFSVAAVMLILIIILLLVKPSDETLEDIDEKVISKRKEATDKHKNNK